MKSFPEIKTAFRAVSALVGRFAGFLRLRPRTVAERFGDAYRRAVPYLAETGTSVFTATAALAAFLVFLEARYPGFVAPYIAPQTVISVLVAGGILAQLGPEETEKSSYGRPVRALVGVAFAVAAYFAAWYYFLPFPAAPWLALAAALAAGVPFWMIL